MGLEDNTIDEGRRTFLRMGLVGAGYKLFRHMDAFSLYEVRGQDPQKQQADDEPTLKKGRLSFDKLVEQLKSDPKGDKAGNYEQLKYKYIDQVLVEEFKIVVDQKRNPDGFASEFMYWQDPKQQKKALARIKDDLSKEDRAADYDTTVKSVQSALPNLKVGIGVGRVPGKIKKAGYLLVDSALFTLANEEEVFSLMDYVKTYAHDYAFNINVNNRALDVENYYLKFFGQEFVELHARSVQLSNTINGKRKLTDQAKRLVEEKYLGAYKGFRNAMKQTQEKTSDFERTAHETMESYLNETNDRMKSLGYEHKLVDEKENKYELAKIKK